MTRMPLLLDAVYPPLEATLLQERRARAGVRWIGTSWTPAALRELLDSLEAHRPALERLGARRLREVWMDVLDELVGERAAPLRETLARLVGLSPASLDAGLDVMTRGVRSPAALAVFDQPRRAAPRPALVVLTSSPPALALQTLLPALAVRRPVLFKSSSDEPLVAPWLVEALAAREPALGRALAAVSWPGGSESLDRAAVDGAGRVIAYGGVDAMATFRELAGARLVAHGPRASVAVVARDAVESAPRLRETADGLARDVALFDQRGCLSVQAVYTDGDPIALADALAAALDRVAKALPPAGLESSTAGTSGVRQLRDTARMAGRHVAELSLESGTVLVDPDPSPRLSPGLRTVRVHPLDDLAELPARLEPWRGLLQGIAHAGADSVIDPLRAPLRALGATRIAPAGFLQSPSAHAWHNGGVDPLEALAG